MYVCIIYYINIQFSYSQYTYIQHTCSYMMHTSYTNMVHTYIHFIHTCTCTWHVCTHVHTCTSYFVVCTFYNQTYIKHITSCQAAYASCRLCLESTFHWNQCSILPPGHINKYIS